MAVLKVEDLFGSFEVMMFNKMYEQYKEDLFEDSIIKVNGKLSIRTGDRPIVIAETFEVVDGANASEEKTISTSEKIVFNEQEQEVKQKMYMQFNLDDTALKDEIMSILSSYHGNCDVFVQHNKKLYLTGKKVNICPALISELAFKVGQSNIKVI